MAGRTATNANATSLHDADTGEGFGDGNPLPVKVAEDIAGEYETVAASQTDQVMGATGAAGDLLARLLLVPATTSPGAVSIKDGAGGDIVVFTGGASSVASLVPIPIPLNLYSLSGAWKITTGSAVSVIACGNFT